ncbi:MAG: glycogen/starch synthase, partial [Saprospiraceae bacterium]|nr:glycogen/starch synthase [Saprospiraceae bacterium]
RGNPFEDNPDRMVFFCKGVIETVKKFGWPPDIVHCHGWMTSLIPLYLKTAYKTEPLFQHSKVVYSAYEQSPGKTFSDKFVSKATINNLDEDVLSAYQNGNGINLHQGAITYADALITGSEQLNEHVAKALTKAEKPLLEFQDEETFLEAYLEFYQSLMKEEVEG